MILIAYARPIHSALLNSLTLLFIINMILPSDLLLMGSNMPSSYGWVIIQGLSVMIIWIESVKSLLRGESIVDGCNVENWWWGIVLIVSTIVHTGYGTLVIVHPHPQWNNYWELNSCLDVYESLFGCVGINELNYHL